LRATFEEHEEFIAFLTECWFASQSRQTLRIRAENQGWFASQSLGKPYKGKNVSDYRRWYVPGGTYFFTLAAENRRPIFGDVLGRRCLRIAWRKVRQRWPFETVAVVVLPDHLHAVWALPPGDDRYSLRLGKFKEHFTRNLLSNGGRDGLRTESRVGRRERGLWHFGNMSARTKTICRRKSITSIGIR
jgi:REP element-mobilizing transposase RayT